MRYENILVPYDGSDPAKRALEAALDIMGDEMTATVHVIRFVTDDETSTGGLFSFFGKNDDDQQLDRDLSEAQAELEAEVEEALDREACHSRVACALCVDASDGIVDYVEASAIDLVIMGSRGLGGVRSMFGSVSNWVLQNVDIPVMIVK